MARRWFGQRAALLAGLFYATSRLTLVYSRQMTTDSLLTLWFLVAMYAFWSLHSTLHTPHSTLYSLLFWAACALAVLTNGVIGLLLPRLGIGVTLLRKTRALPILTTRSAHPPPHVSPH